MTMNSIMGKPLKHYATDKTTHARYFMLALENDTDKNTCSVVDMDALNTDLRAELTEIINSDECQKVIDPWKVLDTKFFMDYPKQTILNVLRAMRLIKVVDSENVLVQLPNDQTMTPKQIMEGIREYNSKRKAPILHQALDTTEVAETKKLEEQNASDIKELKEQVSSLTSSVTALVEALKSNKKK